MVAPLRLKCGCVTNSHVAHTLNHSDGIARTVTRRAGEKLTCINRLLPRKHKLCRPVSMNFNGAIACAASDKTIHNWPTPETEIEQENDRCFVVALWNGDGTRHTS